MDRGNSENLGGVFARSLDEELWRRAEARREAGLYADASEEDRLLLPLVLSLARLAAQRDASAGI